MHYYGTLQMYMIHELTPFVSPLINSCQTPQKRKMKVAMADRQKRTQTHTHTHIDQRVVLRMTFINGAQGPGRTIRLTDWSV